MSCAIVWFRRDLRLADNPALQAALDSGHEPIPVYIHAPAEESPWSPGAASQAWLHHSLQALDADLRRLGSRLLIRAGATLAELEKLCAEADAEAVYWNRLYEPATIARDTKVKQALRARGLHVQTGNAALLVEPWAVATLEGQPYRVFTPFWRNASQRLAGQPVLPAPSTLPPVPARLHSDGVHSLALLPLFDWDGGFWERWQPGEAGAQEMLDAFIDGAARGYKEQRNFPDRAGSSLLSPHLHYGEISPRQIRARLLETQRPLIPEADSAHYISELGWREFSHHLLFHYPHIAERNLNAKFDGFHWQAPEPGLLRLWQQGRTGVPLVDAGMRELWHTGWMHNRVRMVVASFLTKNLRYHWSHGARWFWDTLVDADLANNTQGWQWSAGTGADAAPYFRIFSPKAQAERFDAQGRYIRRWVPELAAVPLPALFAPWEAPELVRRLAPDYPRTPIVDLAGSRHAALHAYQQSRQMSA